MEVTYVIPVYNCAFLADTIESILDQSVDAYKIIVIDDKSSDQIDFLKRHYTQVVWLSNKERCGAAFSRNQANAIVNTDIISVCDAGDVCNRLRTERTIKFFKENPKVDIMYGTARVVTSYGETIYVQQPQPWTDQPKPPISHPTVSYRKHVLEKCSYHDGFLETDLYEFFMIDLKKQGYNFGFVMDELITKRDLTGSRYSRDIKSSKEIKRDMYKKYEIEIPEEEI